MEDDWLTAAATWLGLWGGLSGLLLMLGQGLYRASPRIVDLQETFAIRVLDAFEALDRIIFGEKLWSWRLVLIGITQTLTITTTAIGLIVLPTVYSMAFESNQEFHKANWAVKVIVVLFYPAIFGVVAVLINIIPDILSIAATRFFVRKLKKEFNKLNLITIIFIDFLKSVFFSVIPLFLLSIAISVLGVRETFEIENLLQSIDFVGFMLLTPFVVDDEKWVLIGGIAVSSVLTSASASIWLWLYILGWGSANCIDKSKRPISMFGGILAPGAYGSAAFGLLSLIPYLLLR